MILPAAIFYGASAAAITAHLGGDVGPVESSITHRHFQQIVSAGTNFNFTGISVGAGAANRKIVVLVHARGSGGTPTNPAISATIGGASPTVLGSASAIADTTPQHVSAFMVNNTSSSTIDVSVTSDIAINRVTISVYTVVTTGSAFVVANAGGNGIHRALNSAVEAGFLVCAMASYRTTSGNGFIGSASTRANASNDFTVFTHDVNGTYTDLVWTGLTEDGQADTGTTVSHAAHIYVVFTNSPEPLASRSSYFHSGGQGDRSSIISVSTTGTVSSGAIENIIDGSTTTCLFAAGQTNVTTTFDFGSGAKKFISHMALLKDGNISQLGTLQWEASNDNSTWHVLTDFFPTNGNNGWFVSLNRATPVTGFRYYRLRQVGGTTDAIGIFKVWFKILDVASAYNVPTDPTPAYAPHGSGGGRFPVVGGTITWDTHHRTLVNGNLSENVNYFSPNGQSGRYIQFDFGSPVRIDAFKWHQSTGTTHGTWKWQYFNGSTWVDVGSSFTLGGMTEQTVSEPAAYGGFAESFRLTQVSGSASNNPYIREIEFSMAPRTWE